MDIEFTAARLETASNAYYNNAPIMSDAEYDALEASLRKVSPDHPVFAKVGAPPSTGSWTKVTHLVPMGSLNKAQTADEYEAWHAKSPEDKIISEKLDGISLQLTYRDGQLVRGETRGDGLVGQDITRNVRIMKGVPASIALMGTVVVRSEVICKKSDFAAYFQGDSNPRNTASGTASCQSGWQACAHLTVLSYNLTVVGDKPCVHRAAEMRLLEKSGFETPNWWVLKTAAEVEEIRDSYIAGERDKLDYLIDGLVIEINYTDDREAMGARNLRPKGAIAYKFEHDEKVTTLVNILWQVGNSGRVTPVALFKSVELAGANVTQASLHNVANIENLVAGMGAHCFHEGDEILVSRRNDVIPYVEALVSLSATGLNFPTPSSCPSCGTVLIMRGKYLMCESDDCPAQVLGALKRWVSKLNILHLGGTQLAALIDVGLVASIGDLYRLEEAEFAAVRMSGRRIGGMAKRAMKSLNEKRELPVDLFIGSLGIHLIGRKMVKLLVEAGIDDLNKMAKATEAEMAAIPGFGSGRAFAFRTGFDECKPLILDIMAAGVKITKPSVSVAPVATGDAMQGQAFCFTGVRDKEAEAEIVAQGGEMKSGVSKKVTILVCKDPTSTSGKAKKARALGIELITLETLWQRLGA
jgi:DNA ligase (NAD+)